MHALDAFSQNTVYYSNSALFEETIDFVKYPYKHYDIDDEVSRNLMLQNRLG